MKANIELNLRPFNIPNYVRIDDNHKTATGEDRTIPLHMIDASTLEKMCEQFTNMVFKKAKRNRPPTQAD